MNNIKILYSDLIIERDQFIKERNEQEMNLVCLVKELEGFKKNSKAVYNTEKKVRKEAMFFIDKMDKVNNLNNQNPPNNIFSNRNYPVNDLNYQFNNLSNNQSQNITINNNVNISNNQDVDKFKTNRSESTNLKKKALNTPNIPKSKLVYLII